MTTLNLELPELVHRERNGEVTHNEAINRLDIFSQPRVEAILTAQPGSPGEGQYWIVGIGATGTEWAGKDNNIAHFYNSVWHFYTPKLFYRFRNKADGLFYVWNGLDWLPDGPYGVFLGGTFSTFTLNTTDSKLINFSDYGQYGWSDPDDTDPVAGEITIPRDGFYGCNAHILGTQGNSTKEEYILLKLDIAGGTDPGRFDIGFVDVTTDKTSLRQASFNFSRVFQKDQVLSLYMWASASLGTFTPNLSTFEIEFKALDTNIVQTSVLV